MQHIRHLTSREAGLVSATATYTNAQQTAAFDLQDYEGPITFLITLGAISATNTTAVTLEESDASGSGFAASDNDTFSIVTADATTLKIVHAPKFKKRYCRLSYAAPTGSGPSTVVSSVIAVGQPKTSTASNGNAGGPTDGF